MLVNQITVCGRLGRDPDMSYSSNGKAVTKFSIAVDQGKDKPAMWLNIVAWERLAERINEQARKGNEVFVQGRLTMREYDDRNGQKRLAVDVVATSAQLTQRPQPADSASDASGLDDLGELDDHPF
jgi:single-strand DNA-binding protein